jgi:prevent-host-death family protein
MKSVKSSDAKARFSELLDDVERGDTIVITRHGKVIARMIPDQDAQRQRAHDAIEGILALRKQTKPVSIDEIIAWKNEGRE